MATTKAGTEQSVVAGLVQARNQQGLTQAELAARMGVSASVVTRMESGAQSVRVETLTLAAVALGKRLELSLADAPRRRGARPAEPDGAKAATRGSKAKSPAAAKQKAATRPAAARDQKKPAAARPSREVKPVTRTATRRRFT